MVYLALVLLRGLHLGSGLLLLTVVAFRWLILRPAFRDAPEEEWAAFAPLGRRLDRIFVWAQVGLMLSGLGLFAAVSAGMSGQSPWESLNLETWETVALQTQFGQVFLIRLGLALLLAVLTWRLMRGDGQTGRRRSRLETVAAFVAAVLLVSFALTGHAAASSGMAFWWNVAADSIHLTAAAIWPTGLLPFALFLANARSSGRDVSPAVRRAVGRFSGLSLATVLVLTASGLTNAWFLVGSVHSLFITPYGQVLLGKMLLFLIILGIASWNRFRILPLLFSRAASAQERETDYLLGKLRRFVLAEFALAVGVLIVVSVLGTLPPAR